MWPFTRRADDEPPQAEQLAKARAEREARQREVQAELNRLRRQQGERVSVMVDDVFPGRLR